MYSTVPYIVLCLGSIGMDCVINESYYKGTTLKGIIAK